MSEGSANRDAGGVVLGIFGSLVGTVLATVGLILITLLLNFFFSAEVVLIPIAGAFFARLFKGSMNLSTIIFNIIFGIAGSIVVLLFIDLGGAQGGLFFAYYILGLITGIVTGTGMINKDGKGKQGSATNLLRDANAATQFMGGQTAPPLASNMGYVPVNPPVNTVDNGSYQGPANPPQL